MHLLSNSFFLSLRHTQTLKASRHRFPVTLSNTLVIRHQWHSSNIISLDGSSFYKLLLSLSFFLTHSLSLYILLYLFIYFFIYYSISLYTTASLFISYCLSLYILLSYFIYYSLTLHSFSISDTHYESEVPLFPTHLPTQKCFSLSLYLHLPYTVSIPCTTHWVHFHSLTLSYFHTRTKAPQYPQNREEDFSTFREREHLDNYDVTFGCQNSYKNHSPFEKAFLVAGTSNNKLNYLLV